MDSTLWDWRDATGTLVNLAREADVALPSPDVPAELKTSNQVFFRLKVELVE